MRFAVAKEKTQNETRVAIVPDVVKMLVKKGHQICIQTGAGAASFISDQEFEAAGAKMVSDVSTLFRESDCILKVHAPTDDELAMMEGKAVVAFLWPHRNPQLIEKLVQKKITSFSMDAIPRITRAQSMDSLSSMTTISGYKAVLLAASHLPKFLPMLTTAAGTIRPSQGLIIGAGVAGLQAIATARRLGAVVEAFDMRPAVKEQVLSLGANYVELKETSSEPAQDKYGYAKEASAETLAKQKQLLHERVKLADFVITTAQIPGKPAPKLITKEMVADMKPGSVIIDLAGETGGNCDLTVPGQTIVANFVTIAAPLNLPATMPLDASRMYSRNIFNLVSEIVSDKGFTLDWTNEVFRETCITHGGELNAKRGTK